MNRMNVSLSLAVAIALGFAGAASTTQAQAGLLDKGKALVKKASTAAGKVADKVVDKVVGKAKDSVEAAGDFIKKIASKTGGAFSADGLKTVAAAASSIWKSAKTQATKGYEAAKAKLAKVVTAALESKLVKFAEAQFQKGWSMLSSGRDALRALMEDKAGRDRVWNIVKAATAGKIEATALEDMKWVARQLGFGKAASKAASRRAPQTGAQCSDEWKGALWAKSICLEVAASGTVAKGLGVTLEGSLGFCLDAGFETGKGYNAGIVASIGAGVVGGIPGGSFDVGLTFNGKPVSQLDGGFMGVSGEFHSGKGISAGLDWDLGLENFTDPSAEQLIPSFTIAAGIGAGAKFGVIGGYSWILTQIQN